MDNDQKKVEALRAGRIPIYEPGLEELVQRNVCAQRLRFTNRIEEGVDNSQVIFIAVPTPPQPDGSVDLSFIEKVAREIAGVLKKDQYRVIVDKSTVPGEDRRKGGRHHQALQQGRRGVRRGEQPGVPARRLRRAGPDEAGPHRHRLGNSDRALALMKKVYEPFNGARSW